MLKIATFFFTYLLLGSFSKAAMASTSVNLEFGQASSAYNKVKIDGESGTLFNLSPALDSTFYHRLSLVKKFKSGQGIRLLYAPLKFHGSKSFSQDINFNGVSFPSNQKTQIEYQFNSYRGTYFSEIVSKKNFILRIGGTLKIRDALIELKQGDRKKFKKNTGVVPLLYLYSEYKIGRDFLLAFDFDGLAAPQGRAFDIALMAGYRLSPSATLQLGHRILEGGADNEKVYNFSQINYYFTALQFSF
jgi:hypothetical protein